MEDHPPLQYAVRHLFQHAALAERHGAQQDSLRSHITVNIEGFFDHWRYLSDLVSKLKHEEMQGPQTRPLHIFAQYGLLAPSLTKLEENPNIQGGRFHYPLLAAAHQGHEDVVRCLLNSGADMNVTDPFGNTACHLAASQGHLNILKVLLEHPQSAITLQQRIHIVYGLDDAIGEVKHGQEITALLFPKSSLSVSVIDQMCELKAFDGFRNDLLLRWIIDSVGVDIFESKSLWYKCVERSGIGISSIQTLLDGVENIEICEKLLDALYKRDNQFRKRKGIQKSDVAEVAMILFEHGNVEVTESFVDKISLLWKSSQILQELEASGFKIPPITRHHTLCALSNGSPESVSFYVQHCPDDAHSDELLQAAARNKSCRAQAVRMLLSLRGIDTTSDATLTSFFRQISLDHRQDLDVLMTLEDHCGTMVFSMDDVVRTLANYRFHVVRFVLSRCERFSVTESHIIAALDGPDNYEIVDVVLDYDPTFRVRDRLVAETVAMLHAPLLISVYLQHGHSLLLTENVVRAAAHNVCSGIRALDIMFQHDSSAKVSNTMVLEALRSPHGEFLVTLMLEKDPSISMEEDFLIAAASNTTAGALIFEALHAKSRIDFRKSTIEAAHTSPAKRRKIASDRSLLVREDSNKSTSITKKVIEAAVENSSVRQRSKLRFLFQKWGVLTDEDLELFHSTDESMCSSPDPILPHLYDQLGSKKMAGAFLTTSPLRFKF